MSARWIWYAPANIDSMRRRCSASLVSSASRNTLTPSSDIVVTGLVTSGTGGLVFNFAWPTGVPSGTTIYYQFRITDPLGPQGQSRSNTVAALVP